MSLHAVIRPGGSGGEATPGIKSVGGEDDLPAKPKPSPQPRSADQGNPEARRPAGKGRTRQEK
eukprot:10763853-Alexandrium_andersonii.AAC.1